jgi:hypothetical protein
MEVEVVQVRQGILTPTSTHCINPKIRGQVVEQGIQTPTSTYCKIPQVKI